MMVEKQILEKFAQEKTVKFDWKDHFHETEVTLKIPELKNNRYDCWGDWGPMFTLHISPFQPLEVKYHNKNTGWDQRFTLEEKTVELVSPFIAKVRDEFPLMYLISHKEKDLDFHIYLNHDGDVGRVYIKRHSDSAMIYKHIQMFV